MVLVYYVVQLFYTKIFSFGIANFTVVYPEKNKEIVRGVIYENSLIHLTHTICTLGKSCQCLY